MTTKSVPPVGSGNDVHILHVDDDALDDARSALQGVDDTFDVETVSSASEGLEQFVTDDFDCIVSAYELPGTNGIEFLETVRESNPDLPFILFPSSGSEAVASAAITAGATDYIQNEPGTEQHELLADRIRAAVSQYQSERTEQQLVELAMTTDKIFYAFSSDWNELLFIGSAYEEICGRSIADLHENPTDFFNCVHPADRETVRDAMATVSGGEPIDIEIRVNPGEEYGRWIRLRGEPITDETGDVVRIAGFATEITEQRNRRQRRQRQHETLVELATDEAVTSGDFKRALRRITETAADVVDVDRVNVWLAEEETEILSCVDNYDRETGEHTNGMELATEAYPAYVEALETHRAIDATDARSDPRTSELSEYLDTHDVSGLLDGTLRSEGEVIGVICHEHRGGPREWTDDEIEFASDMADIVHRALRNHERSRREQELRMERQQFEKVLETSPVGITTLDSNGVIQRANERAEEIFDLDSTEIVGRTYDDASWEIVGESGEPVPDEKLPFTQVTETGQPVYNVEHGIGSDSDRWLSINAAPLSVDDSDEHGVLAVVKDITERHREEQTLKTLHERTRAMARTENRGAIAGIAVETMDELLGFDGTVMYRFDGTDRLLPLEWSAGIDAVIDDPPVVTSGDNPIWTVFVDGEPQFFEQFPESARESHAIPFASAFVLPVGNHGVLLAGKSVQSTLSTTEHEAAQLIRENLDAALDRADREQRLRERDQALQRQNDRLEQLNRLNTIIRETTAAMIQSETRSDIECRICERIAAGPEYSFVWFGTRAETTGQLELSQWAEMDPEYAEYLDSHAETTPLHEMVNAAIRDGTVQVAQQILEQPAWKPHRSDVLNQAYRSVAVVPVVVHEHVESVLVIHGTAGDLFDDREQAVLEELGDAIGFAVQNLSGTETLEAGTRTEIELVSTDERLFSNQMAAALGRDIDIVGVISGEDDDIRVFLQFAHQPDNPAEQILRELNTVTDVQILADEEAAVLAQVILQRPQLVHILQSHGVLLRSLSVDEGRSTVTAVLTEDVRSLVEEIQAVYPETELQARRDATRPLDTEDTFRDRMLDELTEKQFDALQTALYGGFYEWPRTSTREELAATRDIASSTFSHHLRAAERKVLSAVLDSV